jgi:tetratricopeptide (TPR) repeat protein
MALLESLLADHPRKEAEILFQQALQLEPRAKEAYNNLGTIYSRRQEHKQAREMFQKAIGIDSAYIFPRINLAIYLLDKDVLAAMAREVLRGGGWSAWRKAELLGVIVEALQDEANLERLVNHLSADEHTALRQVLAV